MERFDKSRSTRHVIQATFYQLRTLTVLLLICVGFLAQTRGFNIETKYAIIFAGGSNTHFGYSVALHSNMEGPLALIAAPKAGSTHHRELKEPGAIYKCVVQDQNLKNECEELQFDDVGNVAPGHNQTTWKYYDRKDGMCLGMSLDVQPEYGHVVACAPLWQNHLLIDKVESINPRGACYVFDSDLQFMRMSRGGRPKKLVPFVTMEVNIPNNYDLAGLSATFGPPGSDRLLLGAPGFDQNTGTVVEYEASDSGVETGAKIPELSGMDMDSYAGYSVTMGTFFKNDPMQYFVVGAPRDANLMGKVHIFRIEAHRAPVKIMQTMRGDQFASYFGAAVLGVDLDNNGLTDLLVSAPLYSVDFDGKRGDEGRVYVYMSKETKDKESKLQLVPVDIMGQKKPDARFGLCLADIGDINQDGLPDVAIGAPYEDFRGAVYIYHGTRSGTGLSRNYQQVIRAEGVNSRLRGFGISISRGFDIDNNGYPDLLIGSYISNSAVLLRSYPVVRVTAELTFSSPQINRALPECSPSPDDKNDKACMTVEYCFEYTGNNLPGKNNLELEVTLYADATKTSVGLLPRAFFKVKRNSVDKVTDFLTLTLRLKHCETKDIFIHPTAKDFLTPMVFRLTHKLREQAEDKKKFCKLCPVLDKNNPTVLEKKLVFQTGCADGNVCKADLQVHAEVRDLGKDGQLILGLNKSFIVDISVKNTGEFAYQTHMRVTVSPNIQIINLGLCHKQKEDTETVPIDLKLECDLANPLGHNKEVRTQIKLDIAELPIMKQDIIIDIEVETTSKDENLKNNRQKLVVPVTILVGISLTGYPESREIFHKRDDRNNIIDITHHYILTKIRPSPISLVDLTFFIPVGMISRQGTPYRAVELKSVMATQSDLTIASCTEFQPTNFDDGEIDGPHIDTDVFEEPGTKKQGHGTDPNSALNDDFEFLTDDTYRRPTSPGAVVSDNILHVNCSTAFCRMVICKAKNLRGNRKSATFKIEASLNLSALQNSVHDINKIDVVRFVTDGMAKIQDAHRGEDEANAQVTTDVIKDVTSRPIEPWIIIVSVFAGLLLLALLLFALYKMKFFKRNRHHMAEEREKAPDAEKESLNPEGPKQDADNADPEAGGDRS